MIGQRTAPRHSGSEKSSDGGGVTKPFISMDAAREPNARPVAEEGNVGGLREDQSGRTPRWKK